MRIVVAGTHASGKSTLISDFVLRHPEFAVLPDPFELVDEAWDAPGAGMFAAQLRIAADRLLDDDLGKDVIAERGPVDFLAYLLALAELSGVPAMDDLVERATALTTAALDRVDVLVVLPLTASDPIHVTADEDPELRAAMNDILLELVDDPAVIGDRVTAAEITGDPAARLAALEAVAGLAPRDRRF
ncbi:AAA family ATPase [Leifsonia lichenia]